MTEKTARQIENLKNPVPKDRQKRALNWLNDNLFQKPTWLVDVPYIFEVTDRPDSQITPYAKSAISGLLNVQKLERMGQFAEYGPGNYAPEEFLDDLTDMIFEELYKGRATDSWRRYLQRSTSPPPWRSSRAASAEGTDARTPPPRQGHRTPQEGRQGEVLRRRHPGPLDRTLQDDREGAEVRPSLLKRRRWSKSWTTVVILPPFLPLEPS